MKSLILDSFIGRFYFRFKQWLNLFKKIRSPFILTHPPGHFYSPIPDINQLESPDDKVFGQLLMKDQPTQKLPKIECLGIDLRDQGQVELLQQFAQYNADIPFGWEPQEGLRYYYNNDQYSYSDAIILHCMIRHFRPKNIIEVGSGYSSALSLDTRQRFVKDELKLTFIEPYPARLNRLLREEDRKTCEIHENFVQDVPMDTYAALEENDIFFIDSTHVAKHSSDVLHLFFEILPRLKKGVIVHIHDILWPFEYPRHWYQRGISWNEAFFVRSFLQYNDSFEVMYFNSYMATYHQKELGECLPDCLKDGGGSIWLRKTR